MVHDKLGCVGGTTFDGLIIFLNEQHSDLTHVELFLSLDLITNSVTYIGEFTQWEYS